MSILSLIVLCVCLAFALGAVIGATLCGWMKESQIEHLRESAMKHRLAAESLAVAVDERDKRLFDAEEHAKLCKEFMLDAREGQKKAEAEAKSLREFTVELKG